MSYLMDALRKAERERNIGRVPDAVNNEFATAYIPARKRTHWLPLLLGGLILLNMLMLLAFWWGSRDDAPAIAPAAQPNVPARNVPAKVAAPADNRSAAPTATAAPQAVSPPPAAAAVPTPAEVEAPPAPAPAEIEPAPAPKQPVVTPPDSGYDDQPVPAYTALTAAQKARIPAQTVNGHLFSSIPGRSFVLLNGRRYGEGQRSGEGPAVVYIDKEGAVLDYEGLRYRIDAPR